MGIDLNRYSFDNELWFKSEMTYRQFRALAHKVHASDIENEIIDLYFYKNIRKAKKPNISNVERWLINAWNTEYILSLNTIIIGKGHSFALQWAFPQAYYSFFGTVLALFITLGYTENSHTSVIKKFGTLIKENKFPETISFYADGWRKKIHYVNINKPSDLNSIDLDLERPETIDNQICQFLKSTRELKLNEKTPDLIKSLKIKTKKGKYKKRLSPTDGNRISEKVGITTILDLLYRKRIKANYKDIEIFTYNKLKGEEILSDILIIINRLNLINETYIAKAIGESKYKNIFDSFIKNVNSPILKERFETIMILIQA